MDRFGGVHLFMQAAEHGSFVEAGRQAGVSASAVGKAVARLEERLGVRLFHRSTRSLVLTPEGRLFLDRCQRIQAEMTAAETELALSRETPRGPLRVGLPAMAEGLLLPLLADFQQTWPDIRLDIATSDGLADLIEDGFDAVIRTGPLSDSRLMSRRLGSFRHVLVASPAYLAQWGLPERPADLMHHHCLHHRHPVTGKPEPWPLTLEDGGGSAPDLPVSLVAATATARLFLAARGLGIACIPEFVAADALAHGQVVAILPAHVQPVGQFHLLWPAGRHLSPRVRVFVDHVAAHFPALSTR